MSHSIQTGLVGYGKSARIFHAPLIEAAEGISFRSAVQRHSDSVLDQYPEVRVYRDLKSLLKEDLTELVIITTPNYLHYQQAFEALSAGKHVVVEKPFTPEYKQAEKLIALAERQKGTLTVYHNRRWDGDFLTLKKILKDKSVGQPVEFESTFNRFRNVLRKDAWKEKDLPGSGILYDLGSHLIDQVLQLFGTPHSLYADIRTQRGGVADDFFEIDLHYDNFKAKLKAGMLVADETPRFILRGTKGSYVKYGMDPQEDALASGGDPLQAGWGEEEKTQWGTLRSMQEEEIKTEKIKTLPGSYLSFYNNLADAILNNKPHAVKAEEAAQVIKLIELAKESSRQKKVLAT
ncbi:MAG: oxidoreductase [Balneolaceae bacterium]